MQAILVYIIFGLALAYAGWKTVKSLTHKEKPGCSKCEGSGIITPMNKHTKG
jgi:hypothetical protein